MNTAVAPLAGLLLTGGRSTRMQRDKATLAYHGMSQLDWAARLLAQQVPQVFVSVRADQRDDPARQGWPHIVDQHEGVGPIAGIVAAQATHPDHAWLVLACDLPFLDDDCLVQLIAQRDPQQFATAYRSSHDGLPEPLCAIYEPRSRDALLQAIAAGRQCPRKFLIQSPTRLLELRDRRALDNINSGAEYVSAMDSLATTGFSQALRVQYYALLREQAGRSDEQLDSGARTPGELYAELSRRYPFTLTVEQLRVAINGEFADWSQPLTAGDRVVFIPPVAGG